jgi:anti-sigma regulatory factor (Ser/Thr protein kinase)
MEDLSLHVLDIVENSVRAEAKNVSVRIEASAAANILEIEITDNGRGMNEEQRRRCEDPFYTTKACKRVGMGLSLLKQSALEADGSFHLNSQRGEGTTVSASFLLDHIDRKPLGDIAKTFYILIAAFPDVDFRFVYKKDDTSFDLDTSEIKKELGDIPISSPDVLKTVKTLMTEGIQSVGRI